MFIKNFLNDLNISDKDLSYLTVLLVFSIIFTFILINQKMSFNIRSDALIYLKNSLIYAGLNGNIHDVSTMYLSPVICFLSGALMSLGFGKESLYLVTGFFAVLDTISVYVLLKYRFNRLLSLFGSVLLTSFSLVIIYWADGTLDIPVLCLSAWTIIFLILAVYENPKYYLICFPLAVVAIFTRFSAFFMLPLILLYYLSRNDFFNTVDTFLHDRDLFYENSRRFLHSRDFRYILIGLIIAILIFIGLCMVITSYGGNLYFFDQMNDSVNGFSDPKYSHESGYMSNNSVYLNDIVRYFNFEISIGGLNLSSILLILLIVGISVNLIAFALNFNAVKSVLSQKGNFKTKHFEKGLYILLVLCLALFIYGLYNSHMLANISMLVSFVVMFSILDKIPISKKYYSMNFLMIAWFLVYFIFFSNINIKSSRYLLSGIIPVIYFIVWAIDSIFSAIQYDLHDEKFFTDRFVRNLTFNFSTNRIGTILKIVLIICIIGLMVNSLTQNVDYKITKYDNDDLDDMFGYLVNHDPDYASKNITTKAPYIARYGTWFIKTDIKFNRSLNSTTTDDYIISPSKLKYPDYKMTYKKDKLRIYERKTA